MPQLTDQAYYILLSLVEAKHGYSIRKEIGELTEGTMAIGPAKLYTLLKKLQDAYGEDVDRKKTYIMTEKGVRLLNREVEGKRRLVVHAERMFEKHGVQ